MSMVVAILLASSMTAEGTKFSPELIANVSLLLARQFEVDCIQIFRTEDPSFAEIETLHGVWKNLATAESRMSTGIYTFKAYLERKIRTDKKFSCYRSLKIMSDDEESQNGYAEFSMRFSLRDPVWLLYTDSRPVEFFKGAHVVFDDFIVIGIIKSQNMISFCEVYKIGENFPLKFLSLGKWTTGGGLQIANDNFFDRRSDLEGLPLRTASVEIWPASYLANGRWRGYLVKLWEEIQALINCTSVNVKADNLVGMKLENGSWNGLVGMAMRNEIDVLVTEIIIDKDRSHALDFFHPIIKTKFQIYTRHLGYRWEWNSILKPFEASVWAAAVAWVFVATFFWIFFHGVCDSRGVEAMNFGRSASVKSFFFVMQALCQQGCHHAPNSYACRVLFFVSYAVSSVLIPSYSASLVSSLAHKTHLKSFDSLEEMVADGSYRLVVKENTAQHAFFIHSKSEFLKLAYEKLVMPVPEDLKKKGIRHSMKALCHLDKYAVMGVEEVIEGRLHHLVSLDCPVVHLANPVSTVYLTMATSKKNPYWGLINHHLGKLLRSGIGERLKRTEFPLGSSSKFHKKVNTQVEVGMQQLASAFLFIGGFTLVSVILLLLEITHFSFPSSPCSPWCKRVWSVCVCVCFCDAAMVVFGFWLFCGLASFVFGVYDTDVLVNLTEVLASHYFSPCIKLIHRTNLTEKERQQIFHVYRALAFKHQETVGVYSYEKYLSSKNGLEHQRSTCLKPMKFVIGGGESREEFYALTQTTSMANAFWLVTLNSSMSQFFSKAKIPFNTELIVARIKSRERIELREVYRVDDNYPLRVNPVGIWTLKEGIRMVEGHLYARRHDLEGKILRAGSIENWPMSSFKNSRWDGYFPRIWKELEKLINCTTVPVRSVDNATGVLKKNGTWNGLVGMAVRGELDVIVSEISINEDRSKVLKYSRPVLISNYQVFFCALGSKLKWTAVLDPFSKETWYAVCAWVALGTVSLSFCYYCTADYDDENIFTPSVSFFFILQSLCQQGYPNVPRLAACRILFMTSYLLSAVLIPSYSASLIYSLTHHTPSKPFDSFDEFLSKGTYDLNVIQNTAQQAYFTKSKNRLLQTVYNRMKKNSFTVHSAKEGLEKTFCLHKNQAYFGVESIVKMHLQQSIRRSCCHIMTFTKPLSPVYQSMAFLKDSPYSGLANYKLQRLFSTGVIDNIQKYFQYERTSNQPVKDVEVGIQDVFQIFVLLLIGLAISVAFFISERFHAQRLTRKRMKNYLQQKKESYTIKQNLVSLNLGLK